MKAIFIAVNVIGGILAMVFGLIALLNSQQHTIASLIVGVFALGLASVCIWLARESLIARERQTF